MIPTRNRASRLKALLDALALQTLAADRWSVIVVHEAPSADPETARVLREHPLRGAHRLEVHPGVNGPGPGPMRNVGWRAADPGLIVFTDDDCRPPPEWLERITARASAVEGAVVQGRTEPDPTERNLLRTRRWVVTQNITPPSLEAQTCNIAYPRDLLEALGGFDEVHLPALAGEDADLCLRAIESGAQHVGAPEALTHHAVEVFGVRRMLARALRWGDLAYLHRRHPAYRRSAVLGIFWKKRHALFLLACSGLVAAPVRRSAMLLALPWLWGSRPPEGAGLRGHLAAGRVIPVKWLLDAAEIAGLARGSIRHRTLFL